MAFFFVIYVPLVVAAWVKVGPIAGVVATAWPLIMFFIASQPGTTALGPRPVVATEPLALGRAAARHAGRP